MTELRPCTACHRHVATTETACPFCQTALPASAARPIARVRLTRAAVFASATLATAGCGGKSKPDTTTTNTGSNTATADAGVQEPPPPPPDHMSPKPYGAPPARRRVV
ncbi:MAG TPA: hypothetical protein VFQ53_26855 [Kofleriaceae bacterium]|nr:hypothetical protein [Kofleriaceae bacterium]